MDVDSWKNPEPLEVMSMLLTSNHFFGSNKNPRMIMNDVVKYREMPKNNRHEQDLNLRTRTGKLLDDVRS